MNNRILIGADEAGYGPNLGPLLVVATAWSIPEAMHSDAFSKALQTVFRVQPWSPQCQHVPLGDSKQLFQPSVGLASLEAGLLALLYQNPIFSQDFPDNLESLKKLVECHHQATDLIPPQTGQPETGDETAPWYQQLDQWPVPICIELNEVKRLASLAQIHLQSHSIELIGIRAAIVTELQFNRAVAQSNSKGQLLSSTTLDLVNSFCDAESRPIEVFCDRQGGRKNYLPILLEAMPDEWFIETTQSSARCSYRNTRQPQRIFHFTVGGDSFAPTALASMLAKYLRERLMQAFNAFWQGHLPNLQPTAGYPLDAKRFRLQIEPTVQTLSLSESMWWRSR